MFEGVMLMLVFRNPHHSNKSDSYLHQSQKIDPEPLQTKKQWAVESYNSAIEAHCRAEERTVNRSLEW